MMRVSCIRLYSEEHWQSLIYFFFLAHKHTVVELGFKDASSSVSEGEESFTFVVEIKNNVVSTLPIEFTVNDTEGEALSECS